MSNLLFLTQVHMPISLHAAKHVCQSVLHLSKGELGVRVEFDGDGQQSCTSQQIFWQ